MGLGNWIAFRCCGDSEWSVRPCKACPPAVHSPGVGLHGLLTVERFIVLSQVRTPRVVVEYAPDI